MLKSIPSTVSPGAPPKNQPQIVGVGFLRTPLLLYTYAAARPLIFFCPVPVICRGALWLNNRAQVFVAATGFDCANWHCAFQCGLF